jgi:hypothetical protein
MFESDVEHHNPLANPPLSVSSLACPMIIQIVKYTKTLQLIKTNAPLSILTSVIELCANYGSNWQSSFRDFIKSLQQMAKNPIFSFTSHNSITEVNIERGVFVFINCNVLVYFTIWIIMGHAKNINKLKVVKHTYRATYKATLSHQLHSNLNSSCILMRFMTYSLTFLTWYRHLSKNWLG